MWCRCVNTCHAKASSVDHKTVLPGVGCRCTLSKDYSLNV